jgi:ABC-type Fe3+-hydroxamate transport system substrate-binding protein
MKRLPTWFVIVLALAFLVALAAPALAADAKGKIKTITADKNEFVITDADGKDLTFTLDPTAKVTLADKDVKLGDLKVGAEVDVKYDKKGDAMIAKEVKCKK